ncbi:unnamed protein product, partial [Prorocentrum cordatum]
VQGILDSIARLEDLREHPPLGVSGSFVAEIEAQPVRRRGELEEARAAAEVAKAAELPRPARMRREASAAGTAEKRLDRARKALEAKREARELVEQLAALDAELEEDEAFRRLEAEIQAAAEAERLRQAAELAERSHVPGLLTQLRGLQAAHRAGNFECAWSEIEKQMPSVAAQLALANAPPRESWAESCPIDDELDISDDEAPLASAADQASAAAAALQGPQQWGSQAFDLEVGHECSLSGPRCGGQVGLPFGQSGPRGDIVLPDREGTTGVGQVSHPTGLRGSGKVGPPRGQPDLRGSSALVGNRGLRRVGQEGHLTGLRGCGQVGPPRGQSDPRGECALADSLSGDGHARPPRELTAPRWRGAQPCMSPMVRPGTPLRPPPGGQEEGRRGGSQPHVDAAPALGGGREAQLGGPGQQAGGVKRVDAADAIIGSRVRDLDPTAQAPTAAFAEALASGLVVLGCSGSGWRRSLEALEGHARLVGLSHRLLGVEVMMPSGLELMVASAYFEHSIGPRAGNLDLLRAAAQLTMASGRAPWLLQADFNMEPAALQELSWPECHYGVAIGPLAPTCFAEKQEKTFDWFVASQDLAHAASTCRPAPGPGLLPHSPVELTRQGARPDALVQALKKPRPFPHRDIKACEAQEGERPGSLALGRRQWMAVDGLTLIGIHGIDQQQWGQHCGREAEAAEEHHTSHEGWHSSEAHRRCKRLVLELDAAASSGHGFDIGGDREELIHVARVKGVAEAVIVLRGRPAAAHRHDASRSQAEWREWAEVAVQRGGRLAHRFARERLLAITQELEDAPCKVWPAATRMALIPKPAGGVRPIAPLPLMFRLWSRLRQPVCSQWLPELALRGHGGAVHGGVHHQRHDPGWLRACRCLAKLPMLDPLLAMTVGRPLVCPGNVVDDVSLQAIGTERLVVQQLSEAGAQLVSMLVARHLLANATKTHLLASTPAVARGLKERWQFHGWSFSQELQARNLGTDACWRAEESPRVLPGLGKP